MIPERKLREEIIKFSHLCYERHMLVAMDGNLSVKLSENEILCTKAGCHKGFLVDEDLVVIDRKGKKLRGSFACGLPIWSAITARKSLAGLILLAASVSRS